MGKKRKTKVFSPRTEKTIDELTLMDDDLMARAFDQNIPATQLLLRTILQENIEVIEAKGQVDMKNPLVKGRSIRLDIVAKDQRGVLFDCEVQRKNKGAHPRRARFHSAMLDTRMLKKKEEFDDIKDSYVIFITETDCFGKGKPIYTVERRINDEDPFEDGNHIIYVNGQYTGNDELGRLISDMKQKKTNGFFNKELEAAVRHFKVGEGRAIMCEAFEKYGKEQYDDGMEKGQCKLIQNMLRNGMTAEEISLNAGVDLKVVKKIEKALLQTT